MPLHKLIKKKKNGKHDFNLIFNYRYLCIPKILTFVIIAFISTKLKKKIKHLVIMISRISM